jgi:uncharacterized oxidoreductase
MIISGNTILITGGSAGIGLALTKAFLEAGNKVLICGRREERLREVQDKYPQIHYMVCDVAKQEDREKLFEWATTFDVNVLINNAGIQMDVDFTKGMDDLIGRTSEISINFEAPVYLTALFTPYLIKKKNAAIINFTTGLAFMTSPRETVPLYIATKTAIHSFTSSLRKQLKNVGVRVFEVIPPIVDTEINIEGRVKRNMPSRGIKPEEFVPIILEGLAKDCSIIHAPLELYPQPLELLFKER